MNHADRKRLSQLLTDIDDHCDNLGLGYGLLQQAIDEARAIVDGTTMCGNCGTNHPATTECPPIENANMFRISLPHHFRVRYFHHEYVRRTR